MKSSDFTDWMLLLKKKLRGKRKNFVLTFTETKSIMRYKTFRIAFKIK